MKRRGLEVWTTGSQWLTSAVYERVRGEGPYEPGHEPLLSRTAHQAALRVDAADAADQVLVERLPRAEWLVGRQVHAFGAPGPIPY